MFVPRHCLYFDEFQFIFGSIYAVIVRKEIKMNVVAKKNGIMCQ